MFVFDDACSHSKQAEDALSAHHMPKGTSKPNANWMVKIKKHGDNGKFVHGTDGKPVEVCIPMGNVCFSDGSPQSLYFPPDHPMHPGLFKGMAVILEECGHICAHNIHAECLSFKCPKDSNGEYGYCCCQHILFNEPNFMNVPSLLSSLCAENNILTIFLPNSCLDSIQLNNVGGMQSTFITNFHPHLQLRMSSKILKLHLLQSLLNVFRSRLTPFTSFCPVLTNGTGSKTGLSIMKIVTRKVLMARLLGQAVTSTVTVHSPLRQPRK